MDGNSTLCQCLVQVAHQPADSPPCDWIPTVHAGMTGFIHLCIRMSGERGNDQMWDNSLVGGARLYRAHRFDL